MKSLAVAVFVFPATSVTTSDATRSFNIPALPPAPVLFPTSKVY
jgi:hypothetical protein